ncbi:hypothetical protein RB195_019848 [Necator americanus]|uniref:c-SKI SMAD4-binding domain-containing protein n=1 Tax=Necator americanus TaxID=51031 RepID=A0ABR1CG17_NECAM
MAAATENAAFAVDPLLYNLPGFPSAIPIAATPAMSPCDSDGIAAWVTISGSAFPAMVLGGEPRVPIHLLLSRVLLTQGVSEIQAMLDDLNIHKSIATSEQADRLRKMDSEVSGSHDLSILNLITRSDAERICGIVRIESDPSPEAEADVDESERLSVQHHVFGTVDGWVYPSRKGGRSVRCSECKCFFTPEDFVAHSHTENRESQRTVHWGFDPSNWRLMLELAPPSLQSSMCREQWKQFIDEKTDHHQNGLEENIPTNKAKRATVDYSEEVPVKVARSMDSSEGRSETIESSCADSSNVIKARNHPSGLFGSKSVDPLVLLNETMMKEIAFKVKSLASINAQPSSSTIAQLIPLDRQPIALIPDPSTFMLVDENVKRIKSSCEKLEAIEYALKQFSPTDPTVMVALRDVRISLLQDNGVEYQRLRCAYDFLFTLFRQLSDPIGCINDPLMRAAMANLRADHISSGVTLTNGLRSASHQQVKHFGQGREGTKNSSAMIPSLATSTATADPQLLQNMFVQQLMQFTTTP